MTSATEELRRLLEERGTEHTDLGGMTEWTNGCGRVCRAYTRHEPLTVDVAMLAVPPEQAIAATLGQAERTCKLDYERHCSNCGVHVHKSAVLVRKDLDGGAWTVVSKPANYCPNCGARVEVGDA